MPTLKSINGVEIFSAGTWNGDTYTEADIDEMVRAFNATSKSWTPALKLGHTEDQKLIQADGLPAAGWIGNIYRVGKKLVADFVDIPEKIYELIQTKAYKRVSSEIYWNITVNGTKYPYLVGAVALLGADLPGVQNLSDIIALYGLDPEAKIKIYEQDENKAIVRRYELSLDNDGGAMPTENEIKLELELKAEKAKAEEAQAQLKKFTTDLESRDSEIAELKKFKEDSVARERAAFEAKEKAETEAFVDKLVSENLATPAMKPFILEILGADKKEYALKVGDEEKKLSKKDLIKETLKLHSALDVNRTEGSTEGLKKSGNSDDAINEKIEKYIAEHKCDYKTAYKAVTKEVRPRESAAIQTMAEAE